MTIRELIQMAEAHGYSLDTNISIIDTEVQHIKFTRESGYEVVILDECPLDEEEE